MSSVDKNKNFEELLDQVPEDQKRIVEQFKHDLETTPIRPLNKEEREIYGAAVVKALQYLPSFRDALAVLSPYMDATCSTAYTDKYARMGLSYWFFYLADMEMKAIALLHEAMHVMNSHFSRASMKKIKPRRMNIAGDLEINSTLSMLDGAKNHLKDFLLPDSETIQLPYYKTLEQYDVLLSDKLEEERHKRAQEEKEQGDSGDSQDGEGSSSDPNASEEGDAGDKSDQGAPGEDGSDSQDGASGDSSEGSEGDSGSDSGEGTEGDSGDSDGEGESSSQGGSGSGQSQRSGYGQSFDSYVDDVLGRKKRGGSSSLEDLLSEDENSGKCNGNHSGDGEGECDGSCDHSGDGDSDGDGNSQGSGKGKSQPKQKVPDITCDRGTEQRSEAADEAGIDRSSVTEQNIARHNTRARVVNEVNKNKSRGEGSNNDFLQTLVNLMNPPKIDWKELFRRKVASAFNTAIRGRSHHSYKRVNRRSQGDVILPGNIDYQPTAMLGVDTSGSMDNQDFKRILTEAESIMKEGMRSKDALTVFSVDTQIKDISPVKSVSKLKLYGGGGTDMSVAFAYVNSLPKKKKPNIFVLGTDGYTAWESVYRQILASRGEYTPVILITQKDAFDHVPEKLRKICAIMDVSDD